MVMAHHNTAPTWLILKLLNVVITNREAEGGSFQPLITLFCTGSGEEDPELTIAAMESLPIICGHGPPLKRRRGRRRKRSHGGCSISSSISSSPSSTIIIRHHHHYYYHHLPQPWRSWHCPHRSMPSDILLPPALVVLPSR